MSTSKKFNVCCNPFNLNNHIVKNSLRLASINIQRKFNISSTDYLCTACRKKLGLILKDVDEIEKDEEKELGEDKGNGNEENKDEEAISASSSNNASPDNEEIEAIGELLDRTLSGIILI